MLAAVPTLLRIGMIRWIDNSGDYFFHEFLDFLPVSFAFHHSAMIE
jgi:hypothetical protein